MRDDKTVLMKQGSEPALKTPWRAPVLSVIDIDSATHGWINQAPADDTTTASGNIIS